MTTLNGFQVCPSSSQLGTFRVPGTSRSLTVRRDIAPLLIGAAAEWHAKVEPITVNPFDDWGYACRRIRGGAGWSYHSTGCAIDLNATEHPLGRRGTVTRGQAATIRAIARSYGLRWGGDWSRPDEMHLEVALDRGAALALVARIQRPKTKASAIARPVLSRLEYGDHNSDVVRLQQRLKQLGYRPGPTDGIYGQQVRRAVQDFQEAQGWRNAGADGLMGPMTLARLWP